MARINRVYFVILVLTFSIPYILCDSDAGEPSEPFSAPHSTQEQISAFIQYLRENDNGKHEKIDFVKHESKKPGYVSSFKALASKDIKEGDVLYTYSLKDTINLEKALEDPKVGEVFKQLRRKDAVPSDEKKVLLFDDQIVKLYTLYLKHNPETAPEWKPYFDALPTTSQMQIPLLWTNQEIEELKGTRLYKAITQLRDDIKKEYSELFPYLSNAFPYHFDIDIYTLDELKWVYGIYTSRHWYKAESVFSPILPIIDVFNFREEASVKFVENLEEKTLSIVATEDIEKGEEIFLNDGKIGNRDLLEFFGFVLDTNPANVIDVGLGLDKSDPLFGNKKKLLHQKGLKDGQTYTIAENEISQDLLFALRVFHISVYDLDDSRFAFENKQISSQNELKVAQTLIDLCQSSLSGYPTTIKADRELLKTELPQRKRNAVVFRRGEKRIFGKSLEKANAIHKEVKNGWNLRSIDVPGSDDFKASIGGQEIL